VVEMPRFSKFLHGMALLYPNEVRNSPSWFLEDPDAPGTFTPASIEEMGDQTDVYTKVRVFNVWASINLILFLMWLCDW
jgi:SPX domain protein involved in polyphosphate accumulation